MKVVLCLVFIASLALADDKTDCQMRRADAIANPHPMKVVPKCDANGDYEGLQCHNERFCSCWTKDGLPVTMPSNSIRFCDCLIEQADHFHSGVIGAFRPSCEVDGSYSTKQCWPSTGTCWCVNKEGKQISEPSHGEVNC